MTMKVILVEDESGIRKLLRKIIEQNAGFEVVGETDNLTDAVAPSRIPLLPRQVCLISRRNWNRSNSCGAINRI